jgi:hypothetical protein
MKKDKKYYLNIIKKIEKIRGKNNSNWMNILRIAFAASPKESSRVLSRIYIDDKKIGMLAKKLTR